MSRESRTLAIVLGMALAALAALGYVADRYGRMIGSRASGKPADVEAFIVVRKAMREAIPAGDGPPDAAALKVVRDRALERAGMPLERYVSIRAGYRSWRRGRLAAGTLANAFDVRRSQLDRVDLGRYEPLDL